MKKNKQVAKKGTFRRLVGLVFKRNKAKIITVLFLMLVATFANIGAMSRVQNILDTSAEMVETGSTDFGPIVKIVLTMIALYLTNITFTYTHLRIMTTVGQDSLLHIRNDLFTHMLDLPLSYFDSNKHGDIMSRYTNDVDATRQLISQSLPQVI